MNYICRGNLGIPKGSEGRMKHCYECGNRIKGKIVPAVRYNVQVDCCSYKCAKKVIEAETARVRTKNESHVH